MMRTMLAQIPRMATQCDLKRMEGAILPSLIVMSLCCITASCIEYAHVREE